VAYDEEEIGPVPAPPAAAAGHGGASSSGRPPTWSSIAGLLGVLIAVIVGASVVVPGGGSSHSHTSSSPTSTTTSSHPEPTSELVYLGRLQPSGGDIPAVGDAQLAGHDYPISLLYEDIGSTPSIAAACESQASCRATSYELGGRFTRFQATLGLLGTATGGNSGESQGQVQHWSVVVDGSLVKLGDLTPNSAPDSIDVPLSGARNLELRMIAEPGLEGTIVWGNARVY
jgi:hypothetical protein